MRFIYTELKEVIVIEPDVFEDSRGYFFETYHAKKYADAGISQPFVQDNCSRSVRGTLRGLHYQRQHAQGKLVMVVDGLVFDVAVDIRAGSPTFGKHVSAVLSADNWRQMWVPAGFAHGYCTLEPATEVCYKVTEYYAPDCDRGLRWDDPDLGIAWPVTGAEAILSAKDKQHPRLSELPPYFR